MNSAVAAFLDARGLLPADPKTVALLVHATICMAYAAAAAWRAQAVGEPTTRAGELTPPDVRGDRPLGSGTPQTDDLVSLIDFGAERLCLRCARDAARHYGAGRVGAGRPLDALRYGSAILSRMRATPA